MQNILFCMGVRCAFVIQRKSTVGFVVFECLSVRLSARENSDPTGQTILKFP
jgi:hypothetical protein